MVDVDGNEPENPRAFGWRKFTLGGVGSYEWRPKGECIGWLNGPEVLLDPEASYRIVQQCDGEDCLNVTRRTLQKALAQQKFIVFDQVRGSNTYRRTIAGTSRNVLLLSDDIFTDLEAEAEADENLFSEGEGETDPNDIPI